MHAPTPEFLITYRDMMIAGLARETDKTRKVLAAVPDAKHDYRPEPCARTAWDLAWHIASSDVHFLDGIADLKFNMTSGRQTSRRMSPNSSHGTTAILREPPIECAP